MSDSKTDTVSYVLQDSRGYTGANLSFWAREGGYTSNLKNARVFSKENAFAQNATRPSDVPWPLDYVFARSHRVVDHQYLNLQDALSWPSQSEFYVQDPSARFVGNDLVFVAKSKQGTVIDVGQALVVSKVEKEDFEARHSKKVFWPVGYLDFMSRQAADRKQCDLPAALGVDIALLHKEPQPKSERLRCHSCHVFVSAASYYAGRCPRCGTDNRP